VKREEYCVKEDKSLWGKELKMVKIFLFFFGFWLWIPARLAEFVLRM